jgi:5,10-methylenetetrahydrofolate reductase
MESRFPLVPGIIPIMSAAQIKRFTALCGARIPSELARKLDDLGDNDVAVTEFGIEYATRQCRDLLRAGAPGIHFYTLTKRIPLSAFCKTLVWRKRLSWPIDAGVEIGTPKTLTVFAACFTH